MQTKKDGDTKAPGHLGNQGQPPRKTDKEGKEERYQRSRERAPSDENPTSEPVDADK
jgi:hypothetical protein